MQRISVVGPGGAGKSEFSRRLSRIIKLPLIHLDNLFWNEDGTHISREEFDARLDEAMKGERWILDGDYSRTYEKRIACSDAVFFLDMPLDVCLEGASSRVGTKRSDLPWVEKEFDPDFEAWIRCWKDNKRGVLLGLLEKYSTGRDIVVFRSRAEID